MHPGSLTPTALGWVRADLDRLQQRLSQQVEAIAANPGAGPALYDGAIESSDELAHVFHTLVADGARQVSHETNRLVRAIQADEVKDREAAAEVLLEAMVVLPSYVDRLQAGHHDLPILLLPLINQLRAANGQDPLTEGTVFTPLLDVELPELEYIRKPGFDEPFEFMTARLHRQYEKALQNWLLEQDEKNLLSAVQGICETMRHRLQRYDLKRLWWVATEVVGGLLSGHVHNDTNLRRLLARLGLLVRNMSEGGEDAIDERASTSITQALLFHIGNAEPGCNGVDLVRARFELDELDSDSESMLRARGALTGRDRDMYSSLSSAVEDELAIVKDSLDLELRTGNVDPEQRAQSMEALARLSETLGMLGLSTPGQALHDLIPHFEATAEADREAREAALVGLAEQLLLVESALREQVETLGEPVESATGQTLIGLSSFELRRITCQLLDECVASIQVSQDEVRKRIAGDSSADPQPALEQVSGALHVAGEKRASDLTDRLGAAMERHLDGPPQLSGITARQVDSLADAMAALEMYFAARRDQQSDAEDYLQVMVERLERLDQPEPETAASETPKEPEAEQRSTGTGAGPAAEDEPASPEQPPPQAANDSAGAVSGVPQAPRREEAADPPAAQAPVAPMKPAPFEMPKRDHLPPPIDPELRDIFLEEYETVLETLQTAIPDWMANLEDVESLTEIRRAFHTLKGSGRMVGADELGDFSWNIEHMLNSLLEGRTQNLGDASVMVRLAQATLPALRQRMLQETAGLTSGVIDLIGSTARTLAEGQSSDWPELKQHLPMYLAGILPGSLRPTRARSNREDEDEGSTSTLRAELTTHLEPVQNLLEGISNDRATRASNQQLRALHTIAGALAMSPEGLDAEVAKALEKLLETQSKTGKSFTPDAMFTLISAVGEIQNRLDRLEGQGESTPQDQQQELIRQLETLVPQFDGPATERPEGSDSVEPSDGETAGDEPIVPPSQSSDQFDPGRSVFARRSGEEQPDWQPEPAGQESDLPAFDSPAFDSPAVEPPAFQPPSQETPAVEPPGPERPAPEQPVPEQPRPEQPVPQTPAPAEPSIAGLDQEIVAIFLEEAREVLERSDSALNQWRDDLQQLSWVQNLQREIHTLKGGARMCGLTSLGEYSHTMENLLEQIAGGHVAPSLSSVQLLEESCDRLQGWVDQVAAGTVPDAEQALQVLKGQIEALDDSAIGSQEPSVVKPDKAAVPITDAPATDTPASDAPAPAGPVATPPADSQPAAMVASQDPGGNHIRVSADLLDRLVNAAGEVSIYRSRMEQQFGGLRNNLTEFEKTIDRLREQFRQLEIEIESQMRSSYRDQRPDRDQGFDPLEMDQFSGLQQSSRSLSESVADLLSLQEMLAESTRNSEQLLHRQSRVSTELQEGLMKTRMVPFGTIAARLRRIVRGAAQEAGKQARLQINVVGSSDDLDRNVLEHITTPLEHMMRNAIVHGIEAPSDRQAAGKAAEGEIAITVESEATEFVIRIDDDGAGIDTQTIQRKAIERGLLASDAEPSRQQLYEFMMDSGFSTTETVTRLAGRGVGMDVVSSDIKQIGGSLEIESEPGKGTQFTIRIPFTLAIMQAIGLVAGQQRYLIPLTSVVGVSRLVPAEYTKMVESGSANYRYAGQEYPLLDMEPLLGEPATPLSRDHVSLLILNAGEQKAAIRVPELLPHREVVIKPVGPQISSVPGILGGAVSAEGEVIVILDPGPMIRHALIHGARAVVEPLSAIAAPQKTLVMVIDDSITMRKVTSRVLEGHEYDVITAKDGVDALEQLQERTPDIILCDIEMPRMDGYELTERVRGNSRLHEIPIIMITSRAGKKHRDRATQAGANAYLTKPYQENELINEIENQLQKESG